MVGLVAICVVLAVLPLLLILGTLAVKGAASVNLGFFTRLPVPAGESGGGVAHAIVGTLVMLGLAAPVALVFALAFAPIAFGLACAGAWVGIGGGQG